MEPYEYNRSNGDKLEIRGGRDGVAVVSVHEAHDPSPLTVVVDAKDLPDITGKLHEACGLPVPVILERPTPRETLVAGPHGDDLVNVTPSPGRGGDAHGVRLLAGAGVRLVGDEPLRVALALIDAMREAEAGPITTLRRALTAMRSDAERCGDKPGSFVAEVADWLGIEIAALERKLPDDSGSVHVALRIARAYLGEVSDA